MMDSETQSLIDQLRDKMVGMRPLDICTVGAMLFDGYFIRFQCPEDRVNGFHLTVSDKDLIP